MSKATQTINALAQRYAEATESDAQATQGVIAECKALLESEPEMFAQAATEQREALEGAPAIVRGGKNVSAFADWKRRVTAMIGKAGQFRYDADTRRFVPATKGHKLTLVPVNGIDEHGQVVATFALAAPKERAKKSPELKAAESLLKLVTDQKQPFNVSQFAAILTGFAADADNAERQAAARSVIEAMQSGS